MAPAGGGWLLGLHAPRLVREMGRVGQSGEATVIRRGRAVVRYGPTAPVRHLAAADAIAGSHKNRCLYDNAWLLGCCRWQARNRLKKRVGGGCVDPRKQTQGRESSRAWLPPSARHTCPRHFSNSAAARCWRVGIPAHALDAVVVVPADELGGPGSIWPDCACREASSSSAKRRKQPPLSKEASAGACPYNEYL